MHMFRNPEVKRYTFIFMLVSLLLCTGAMILIGIEATAYTWMACTVLYVINYLSMKKRYCQISDLSLQIDKMLHAKERTYLVPNREGELAILENQIAKLTMRLEEQTEQLRGDKIKLSNAMADISHQIRTPLTSIRMMTHQLMRDNLTQQQRNDCINEINVLLSRIEWLITALLKIARLDSGVVEFSGENVKVEKVIQEAITPLEIMMELKDVTTEISDADGATFWGDQAWTTEAIENILKNSIEHTPPGGRIGIRVTQNSIFTRVTITDNGTGISEDDLPHLFERFYKGKSSLSNNIGIGLALSRMIISRQNGTISAENITPHGTAFKITFYRRTP